MQDDIQLFVHVRILKQTVVAQSYIFFTEFYNAVYDICILSVVCR